jgi:type VI secretion system secreted protein Hcp
MFDAFIKIDGIPGECTDDKHKDWIEVLSFHWGVSQQIAGARSTAGAATGGRTDHNDFSIVKALDKTSPDLMLQCCNGKHIKSIEVDLCRAGEDKNSFMKYNLSDVLITGVRPGGSGQGSEAFPLEEVSFNYGKIELTYTGTDARTGKPGGAVKRWWDTVLNKGG